MNRFCLILMMTFLASAAAYAQWEFLEVSDAFSGVTEGVRAVAWGDIDNDGDPDLFAGGYGPRQSTLYINEGGVMVDRTQLYGLSTQNTAHVSSAQIIDYNQDGYLDIMMVTDDGHGFKLFRQAANQRFQSVSNSIDRDFSGSIVSAAWLDADCDGRLDLILSSLDGVTSPLVADVDNNEAVETRDEGFFHGLTNVGAITVEDYDRDGDADVFVGSTCGDGARLFLREGHGYKNMGPELDLPSKMGATGACWFDYNNDQRPDMFAPGDEQHTILMKYRPVFGAGEVEFDFSMPQSVPAAANGIYAHAVDANMDGWTDLCILKEGTPSIALVTNNRGAGWQHAVDPIAAASRFPTYSCAWADFDGDGDLDLAAAHGTDGVRLYRNNFEHSHEFIVLNLVSPITHAPLRNCSVWMRFESAKAWGSNHMNAATPGGDASSILLVNTSTYKSVHGDLVIRWPNGLQTTYSLSQLHMSATNQLVMPDAPISAFQGDERPTAPPVEVVACPNPFNPSTMLSYVLPEAANVELKVFNLMGQEVAMLTSGYQLAGSYRVAFHAGSLPSGLYISRLTVDGETHLNRLLLAK